MKITTTFKIVFLIMFIVAWAWGLNSCSKQEPQPAIVDQPQREDVIAGQYHTIKSYHYSQPLSSFDTVYGERDILVKKIDMEGLRFINPEANDSLDLYYFEAYSTHTKKWYYIEYALGGNYLSYDSATGQIKVAKGWVSAGGESYTYWVGYKIP